MNQLPNKIQKLIPELKKYANQLYSYYGGNIYLVGSSLYKEECRDIDVRCVVSLYDFERLYGNFNDFFDQYTSGNFNKNAWKWSADRLKRSRQLYDAIKENIDFAVFPEHLWDHSLPEIKLNDEETY